MLNIFNSQPATKTTRKPARKSQRQQVAEFPVWQPQAGDILNVGMWTMHFTELVANPYYGYSDKSAWYCEKWCRNSDGWKLVGTAYYLPEAKLWL